MPNVGPSKGPNPSASKPTDASIADATELTSDAPIHGAKFEVFL